MSRREALLSGGLVFLAALLVRAWVAGQIVFPKPEDTAYYVQVARNLVEGRGLYADALWSYQTPPLVFPRPAFEVWLPLPTFLAAVPMALLGTTFAASQVSSVLVGALVPVVAWRLAADVALERALPIGRARTLAVGTGMTCAVSLPLILHSALPDSTMLFGLLALAAAWLMARIAKEPRGLAASDRRVMLLGLLIGLAALTRNEAAWLGVAWAIVAWRLPALPFVTRVRSVAVAGLVALLVFAPWMLRDWIEFGSPLPGQAAANALSVTGFDIFAWNDPPTLTRYLAVGPARLLEMRVDGFIHNFVTVLFLPGVPLSLIGLVALPWAMRVRVLLPLVLVSLTTFLVTTLAFPVATTWGTFLHAAVPFHVLLVISGLLALDGLIARVGVYRGWTRPVAWLGPTLGLAGSILFTVVVLPTFGDGSRATANQYAELGRRMASVGEPLDGRPDPVISNFPIWLAEAGDVHGLALPNEPPADVLDLAQTFDARLLILVGEEHGQWPSVLDTGAPGSECFETLDLGPGPAEGDPLGSVTVYRIVCP
jgi:hypothetical protein